MGGDSPNWDVVGGVRVEILADGGNRRQLDSAGRHAYLVRKMPEEKIAAVIDELMASPPRNGAK